MDKHKGLLRILIRFSRLICTILTLYLGFEIKMKKMCRFGVGLTLVRLGKKKAVAICHGFFFQRVREDSNPRPCGS